MKLDYLILATSHRDESLKIFSGLGMGIDTIQVSELPARGRFSLLSRLSLPSEECGIEHPLEVRIRTEAGDPVMEIGIAFNTPHTAKVDGWDTRANLNIGIELVFTQSGKHVVELACEGEVLGSERLFVALLEE